MADTEEEHKTEEISTTVLEGIGSDNDEENENEVIDTKPMPMVDINQYLPKKNLTASSTFSQSIANLINRTDLHNCVHLQHEIYKRMNDSQRALQTFNTFSAKEFNKLAPEIERKTKMIQAMKKDLYSIFDRISELREVLGDRFPEYAVLLPEEMEEEEDDFPITPNTPVVERMSFADLPNVTDSPTQEKQSTPEQLSDSEILTNSTPTNAVSKEPSTEPVLEPSPEPVLVPSPEPVSELSPEPAEPSPEPPSEPVLESNPESIPESSPEPPSHELTESIPVVTESIEPQPVANEVHQPTEQIVELEQSEPVALIEEPGPTEVSPDSLPEEELTKVGELVPVQEISEPAESIPVENSNPELIEPENPAEE